MSGAAGRVGDWAFKAFTAGLGVATIYLTATFSVNVYRGLSWHNAQTKIPLMSMNVTALTVDGRSDEKKHKEKH